MERHYLVGTAGHVDHGKTELIRALSGMETDRLKEEKQRGISIELGFAHMNLPSGREVGIVDVPGHERFVRQMLSGAGGMDAVLLVIAADEGMMPQTREHLDILTLLAIPRGIVVLNKIDLVEDDWLELIEEEIKEELKGTTFEGSPIFRISALTGEGIPELKVGIDQALATGEGKKAVGAARMPLDRVFSIQGFGTVVTGTLYSGTLEVGQDLAIEPAHRLAKVRSLQVHGHKVATAQAGQRVAVNLAGIEVSQVEKGAVLAQPNAFPVGNILDIKVHALPSAEKRISQRQRLRFHLGTAEVMGRIHLLDREEIKPGEEAYAQILLEEPVLAAAQDRFVLRFYSPAHTIAGGKVLGVAKFKEKRFKEAVLGLMNLKDRGNPQELLIRELKEPKAVPELAGVFLVPQADVVTWLAELERADRLEVWLKNSQAHYWAHEAAEGWRRDILKTVSGYVKANPLRRGVGREELKNRMRIAWPHPLWQAILEEGARKGYYRLEGGKIQPPEGIALPEGLAKRVDCLAKQWRTAGLTPPDLTSAAAACQIEAQEAGEFAQYFCELGEWISAGGIFFERQALTDARKVLEEYLQEHKEAGVSEIREIWGISRKYAVPLLEYFDEQHLTRRSGDKRILY